LRSAGDAARLPVIARSEDGLIERHRIRSTLYKGRSSTG
jgi:hypothetical protein